MKSWDLASSAREISWSPDLIISRRYSDLLERELYIQMTEKFAWSWPERQIVQDVLAQIESERMAGAIKRDFRV